MFNRRKFIKASALSAGLLAIDKSSIANVVPQNNQKAANFPIVISTWDFGIAANADAWKVLSTGGRALDAGELMKKISRLVMVVYLIVMAV
ncbi:N(4)-(Beta-N-acetylglucosaminyl)-L-asparaginase precursor [compost metagenome]